MFEFDNQRDPLIDQLRVVAQNNADLSDAHHAQSSPLCIYLLSMRDFYRWERALPFSQALVRSDLGKWISAREAHWESLRGEEGSAEACFEPLFPTLTDDPFDTAALRDTLAHHALAYGAGIGRFGRPQFFLGREISREWREGCEIVVCGQELARGITAPPAMSRGQEILIRQDALARWLWTRYEEWQLHPRENGLSSAFELHAAALSMNDPLPVMARMASEELESLILHELGERRIDGAIGESWHDMLDEIPNRKTELLARSVRDLLADCTVTLPTLIEREAFASIHCWFGLLDGTRLKLAPSLMDVYQAWKAGNFHLLAMRVEEGRQHFTTVVEKILKVWQQEGVSGLDALMDDASIVF